MASVASALRFGRAFLWLDAMFQRWIVVVVVHEHSALQTAD